MKSVATKNAKILESRAARHAPELRRVARQVAGTFDKVYEEAVEAVEDFLARCEYQNLNRPFSESKMFIATPKITEVVQDTQVLLQQSRERLIITCGFLKFSSMFLLLTPFPVVQTSCQ